MFGPTFMLYAPLVVWAVKLTVSVLASVDQLKPVTALSRLPPGPLKLLMSAVLKLVVSIAVEKVKLMELTELALTVPLGELETTAGPAGCVRLKWPMAVLQ